MSKTNGWGRAAQVRGRWGADRKMKRKRRLRWSSFARRLGSVSMERAVKWFVGLWRK